MTSAEELIRILEGRDENEEFESDEELDIDEEVIISLHLFFTFLFAVIVFVVT